MTKGKFSALISAPLELALITLDGKKMFMMKYDTPLFLEVQVGRNAQFWYNRVVHEQDFIELEDVTLEKVREELSRCIDCFDARNMLKIMCDYGSDEKVRVDASKLLYDLCNKSERLKKKVFNLFQDEETFAPIRLGKISQSVYHPAHVAKFIAKLNVRIVASEQDKEKK